MTDADANTTAAIRAALAELDDRAAKHIALQCDPNALIKDVRHAEALRDAAEQAIEREASQSWLRYLLAENERLQAVAEAAGAFDFSEFVWYDREDGRYCQFCNAEYKASDHSDFVHDSNCPIDKLQAAVREVGEGE